MKPSTKTFLSELYEIDPGLRVHEADMIPLIEKLLKNDPAQSPDPAFVAQLRTQLRERAAAIQESPASGFSWNNLFYGFGGALAVLVILPMAYLAWNNTETPTDTTSGPLFGYRVEEAGENAFGPLTDAANPNHPATDGARDQSGGSRNLAVPGTPEVISARTAAAPSMMKNDSTTEPAAAPEPAPMNYGMGGGGGDAKMIAPGPMTQYEYVYEGDIKDLNDTVSIFKRDPSGTVIPLSALTSRLNLGTINLDSFRNMNVDSVSFSQNAPFGYQIYINLRDATLSINAQWDQWPQSKCQTEACFQRERVKIGDVPSDEQSIAIAKDFIAEHGVDVSKYSEPEVDNTWKRGYESATDKVGYYISDSLRVIFPLMIEGRPVYDQSGQKTGISVGVNIKEKKVIDVWGISDRTYIKSTYAGVTDKAVIKSFITRLDRWPVDDMPADIKIVKAKVILGEPTMSYATFYNYKDGVSAELLVPSLVFPVKEVQGSEDPYYRQTVVVPLAKEMLTEQNTIPPAMPLAEPMVN